MEQPDRIAQFTADVESADLKMPDDSPDRWAMILAIVCEVIGIGLITFGYIGASGTALVAEQTPYVISGGLLGLALVVAGAGFFVRYSMSRYLRVWMIRSIYEQRAQTDRVVEAIESLRAPDGQQR